MVEFIEPDRLRVTNGLGFGTSSGIERRMTWDEVDQKADRVADKLRTLGASREMRIVLIGQTTPELVVSVRAAVELGAPFLVLPLPGLERGRLPVDALRSRLAPVCPALVLCDASLKAFVESDLPHDALLLTFDELDSVDTRPYQPGSVTTPEAGDQPVLLQYTSGTTSDPRAVVVTGRNLTVNIGALIQRFSIDPGTDRFQSWLPLYHDMGLILFLLLPMLHGVELTISDPSYFARSPRLWMRWIHSVRASVTCAPQFAYSLIGRIGRVAAGQDLSSVRLALNGAEPVDPTGLRRFQTVVGGSGFSASAICCGYGLAEATLAVTACTPGSGLLTDTVNRTALSALNYAQEATPDDRESHVEMALVGKPLAGVEMRITGEDGSHLGDREVGEIHVRGQSVSPGYWPLLEDAGWLSPDEWLNTGDLGYSVDGNLVVCGRKKDIIIIGGRNYSPAEIENAATQLDGVRTAVAFGTFDHISGTESLILAAEVRTTSTSSLRQQISGVVASTVGVVPRDILLVPRGWIQKTTSGKVRRALCREQYLLDTRQLMPPAG